MAASLTIGNILGCCCLLWICGNNEPGKLVFHLQKLKW